MKKIIFVIAVLLLSLPVFAKEISGFGFNAGAGTDITLGLAVGAGASYLMVKDPAMSVEIGFNVFYSSFKDYADVENNNTYYDSATTIIYAVAANALFNYDPQKAGIYTVVGLGAGGVSIDWQKWSIDDPSYNDSGDDTGGSMIINLGVGGTFGNGFELRLQLPIFATFTGYGTIFSPALTAWAGIRI